MSACWRKISKSIMLGELKMKMLFILTILTVLIKPSFSESNQFNFNEKSTVGGVLLGSIGVLGIFIPGTMGWGNFYAKDYVGFVILNGGGSLLNIVTWGMAISLVIQYGSSYSVKSPQYVIGSISGFGSIVFAIASIISGGSSVDRYNLINRKNKVGLVVVPKLDGFGIEVKYSF